MKIVIIKWRDSNIISEQIHVSEIPEYAVIDTVGFLIENENKDQITVCRDILKDDNLRSTITIPTENVISITTVPTSSNKDNQ